jgi:hypothetical protein
MLIRMCIRGLGGVCSPRGLVSAVTRFSSGAASAQARQACVRAEGRGLVSTKTKPVVRPGQCMELEV